jgi:hypothetical protein
MAARRARAAGREERYTIGILSAGNDPPVCRPLISYPHILPLAGEIRVLKSAFAVAIGVERTSPFAAHISPFYPKRT